MVPLMESIPWLHVETTQACLSKQIEAQISQSPFRLHFAVKERPRQPSDERGKAVALRKSLHSDVPATLSRVLFPKDPVFRSGSKVGNSAGWLGSATEGRRPQVQGRCSGGSSRRAGTRPQPPTICHPLQPVLELVPFSGCLRQGGQSVHLLPRPYWSRHTGPGSFESGPVHMPPTQETHHSVRCNPGHGTSRP